MAELLRYEQVEISYRGRPAVRDVSFTLHEGEILGIVGESGSGKSTLVNLIPRFYDHTDGEIKIHGRDIRSFDRKSLLDRIAVVPQKAVLFSGSIRENLKYGNASATEEELWRALELAQARDVVEGKDGKLDFELEQNGRNLSGGQRQRLTIARALVKHSDLLILDDSASALDFKTEAN
jgi:ABC-type multidrug transport system fused ATPase/permease subunit